MKRVLAPLVFGAALMTGPLAADGIGDMTEGERVTFRSEIRDYLLENPEVLLEAIAVLESRQVDAGVMQDQAMVLSNADALFDSEFDWNGGNLEGDLVLVEFMDYRCGYCRRAFPDVERLIEEDGNIRLVIKELPILGEQSVLASRFAISTRVLLGDDAYSFVHDALMTMQGDMTEATLTRLAEGLELDADLILSGINSPDVDEVIAANHALAQRMQISGTPSFVMGDQLLRGYLPFEQMAAIAADIRATAE